MQYSPGMSIDRKNVYYQVIVFQPSCELYDGWEDLAFLNNKEGFKKSKQEVTFFNKLWYSS
jgi:hypothetical protein